MKISACYITKNEERNIVRSLQSLLDSVDEIIVVDTGSTDRTKEAAAGLGARVLDFAWEDDFSAPRNLAIQEAQGDWIIFLDADEWFVEPTKCDRRRSTLQSGPGCDAAPASES